MIFAIVQLHIQKQPGTIAIPVSIQVLLPANAELVAAVPEGDYDNGIWRAEFDLRTDFDLALTWQLQAP